MDYQGSTTRIDLEGMLVDETMEPKPLPFSLLDEITGSFSEYHEIGRGGFAVVYKGILGTGTVAVKKLSNAYIQETEFQREVECLMSVRHKNIVRFLGYCADTQGIMQMYKKKYVMADLQQRLLCFEYVPNGSLRDYITDASCGLAWRKRYQIIKGVCEGLNYLHKKHVVHLDLKPANILMDDNMEPKIADFGLSRCFEEGQSLIMATKVAGTLGYMPPEFDSHAVTRHYDIYSLGVIIIEMLTGKKGYHTIEDVTKSWRNRLEESLGDTELKQIQVCANIGNECTKSNPEKRPRSVQHIINRLKETESTDESSLEKAREPSMGSSMQPAVVTVSHGAMGSLIAKLGDFLKAEYKLLKEAKGQILFLKAELESMHVFLKKISDAEQPNEQDKCWAKEVCELSYDIEDSVHEFMYRMEHKSSNKPHGFKGFINRSTKLLTTMNIRHEIAKEFEGLKVRVVPVRERRLRYQQTNDVASWPTNTTIDYRLLALYADASGLVGMDGPRDEVIQLMGGETELKVFSIVGFGGLGKTTLANEVYRKLQGEFKSRAFVSVSQKSNIRKLLRTMLSQVGFVAPMHGDMNTWKESEFISALRKLLLEQRYLIIIDDIWEASTWDIIRCALPENSNGSRVLITTRIETVARGCCTKNIECVYKMKALCDQDSRSLFFKRIFGSEDACPQYLKEVSAQILKKCGGLPLAIITTSSMIASQPNKLKQHWEHLRDSLGSNFGMSPSLEGMRHILNLSYIHLPDYLKTCMLYLGIYPEDYTIDKNDLARRWIAEGFICHAHGIDLEDIAKCYFNELINRSLIQPVDTEYNGEVTSCRVHDMILDLILHKSREENFVTVIDDIRDMTGHLNKIRRLSLNLDGAVRDRVAGSVQLSQTRTLAIFGTFSYLPPFQLFKHLRILGIEITVRSNPLLLLDFTEIHHLFQLRSLKIVAKGRKVLLPSKIGSMQQLETFEINAPIKLSKGHELPSDIVQLSRLLHLIIPDGIILPNGIGNMKSLRTLHCFNLSNSPNNIKGLGELTNLTNLKITFDCRKMANDEIVEKGREVLQTCLGNLCNLKYLYVNIYVGFYTGLSYCPYFDALSSTPASFCHFQIFHGHKFSRVPRWIVQLHNLYDLHLFVKQVFEEDVGILAKLPSVMNLELFIFGTPEDKIIIRGSGFPVLKRFVFGCSRISCLAFVAGAMPKLEKLELKFNAKGWDWHGAAPTGIEHLSCLRETYALIGGEGAKESNRRAAESALRNAIDIHPRRPAANIECDADELYPFEDCDEQEEQEDDLSSGST